MNEKSQKVSVHSTLAFLYVHGSVHPVRIRIGQLGQNGHINDWTDIEKI